MIDSQDVETFSVMGICSNQTEGVVLSSVIVIIKHL